MSRARFWNKRLIDDQVNITNDRARLKFTSESQADDGDMTPAGTFEGTVKVGGVDVGEIGVYPSSNDRVSTDYLEIDPSRLSEFAGQVDSADVTLTGTIDGEQVTDQWIGFVDVEGPGGHDPQQGASLSDDAFVDDSPSEEIQPEDYALVVNADTPSGVALAPSAVREGLTADPDGTEVTLSDGQTVTVYPRQDADEAIRDPETGELIDSPVGSGGVEGGVGSDSSSSEDVGVATALLALLALGYLWRKS